MSSQHFGFSQVPVNPSFRNASVNAVAVVPLLSNGDQKREISSANVISTHSAKSFTDLFQALRRHNSTTTNSGEYGNSTSDSNDDLLLVVPNSSLTRPGDWRYQNTPLKAFHWQVGCQRLRIHDGRPQFSRRAHDKLFNAATSRDWIDLCPSRRTAAVIGVLNLRDCETEADLSRAGEELQQWAARYSTPPYAVTAHGRSLGRDVPVTRLFVYDSFDDESQKNIDLSQSNLGTSILAFPPSDEAHEQMMNLHLNVVVSDLTVAIFRDLEQKIRESIDIATSGKEAVIQLPLPTGLARKTLSRFVSGGSGDGTTAHGTEEEPVNFSVNLGISQLAGLVSPDSKLAQGSPTLMASQGSNSTPVGGPSEASFAVPAAVSGTNNQSSNLPQLLTPLDDEEVHDALKLGPKDAEGVRKRDMGRREKLAADLCLLAGTPLDAYERYLKAAELCKTGTMDPLWHASALEGCAAAHIAMAEAGGYRYVCLIPAVLRLSIAFLDFLTFRCQRCSVDDYLENNFHLPEEIMALAREDPNKKQTPNLGKQTLPEVVFALCEEALNILNRHKNLGHLYAELLLKLASYCADEADAHLRCRWGEGLGCYPGEQGEEPRWLRTSVSKLKFNPLRTKDGDSMIAINTQNRIKKVSDLLGTAATVGPLDLPTRVDVAVRCARICLDGIKVGYENKMVLTESILS